MQPWLTAAGLLTLLSATLWIYWPGLDGPLLLDDIPNLHPLHTVGPIHDASSFFWFVLNKSTSYPLRPLSYASFLINDLGWPLDVWKHKYTNVLIHLLNGVLVFWLAFLLGRATSSLSNQTICIALTTSALWLLAPLQVSTVLYVVQRMTELSALFVLCGVITYCYARERLNLNPLRALVQMTAGVVFFGALGFFSKENAILLTLYVLVIERTVFRVHHPVLRPDVKLYFRIWKSLVLVFPVVAAFAYIVYRGEFNAYEYRPFTIFEGLVSQPRILLDYAQNLLLPSREGMGLTHDDFVLSTDWLSPPTTIIAILVLSALLVAALRVSGKTASLFSLAVLWFLSGHLLESSFLALERYWEHRNYLPSFGPLFALTSYLWSARVRLYGFLRVALAVYLAMFVLITAQNVSIWSSYATIAETWAADHPRSLRAQQIRGNYWSRRGEVAKADQIIRRVAEKLPDSMGAQMLMLLTACRHNVDDIGSTLSRIKPLIRTANYDHSVFDTLRILMDTRHKACPDLSYDDVLELTNVILENETVDRRGSAVTALLALKATFLSKQGNMQAVVSHLYAAFNRRPTYSIALITVEYLYESGQYELALQVLDEAAKIRTSNWDPEQFQKKHLKKWRHRITAKLNEETERSPTD